MSDLADWLRYERTMHVAAIARIDERLAGITGDPLTPKTPAACIAVLKAASPRTMRVVDVIDALATQGRPVTQWAVYQALRRLAITGDEVERVEGGYRWKGGAT